MEKFVKYLVVITLLCSTAWAAKYFSSLVIQGDVTTTGDVNAGTDLDVAGDGVIDTSLSVGKGSVSDAALVLDLVSTTKAFAPPRMTAAQRDLIGSPVEGSLIYNDDDDTLNIRDGSAWVEVSGAGGGGISNAEYNFIVASEGNNNFDKDVTGWTGSVTAPTHNTSTQIEGDGSLSWDPAGAETLRSDAYTLPDWAHGKNCYAEIYYQGGDTDFELKVLDGSNVEIESTANDSTVSFTAEASGSKRIPITFVCPASGSVKLSLEAGSDEPEIIIDRAYIGQNFKVGEVAQAVYVGSVVTPGTASCLWSVTSTSMSNFAADSDCPVATATGSVEAPGTKIPALVLPAELGLGTYQIVTKGHFGSGGATTCGFRLHDGTSGTNTFTARVGAGDIGVPGGTFTYEKTAGGDVTLQVQANCASGAAQVAADVADREDLSFEVYKYPSGGQQVFATDQSDFGWQSLATVTSQGFGTTSAEEIYYSRVGSNLHIRGRLTVGTVTASEAQITLPLSLVVASNVHSSSELAGSWMRAGADTQHGGGVLITGGDTFINFTNNSCYGTASVGCLSPAAGNTMFGSSETFSFFVSVPIEGWKTSNRAPQLVNSVISPREGVTGLCSFYISNEAGTPTIDASRNDGCADSLVDNGTGDVTTNFTAGYWNGTPNCTCTAENDTARFCHIDNATGVSSSSVRTNTFSATPSATDDSFTVICVGPR